MAYNFACCGYRKLSRIEYRANTSYLGWAEFSSRSDVIIACETSERVLVRIRIEISYWDTYLCILLWRKQVKYRYRICTLHGIKVLSSLYTVHCTVYSVQCKMYTVQCTLWIVHRQCTIYTVQGFGPCILRYTSSWYSHRYTTGYSPVYSLYFTLSFTWSPTGVGATQPSNHSYRPISNIQPYSYRPSNHSYTIIQLYNHPVIQ